MISSWHAETAARLRERTSRREEITTESHRATKLTTKIDARPVTELV
jgi:hypothetical protein